MPLYRRIARRGFSNYPYRKEYAVVNLELIAAKFAEGDTVNRESLIEKGLVKKSALLVKILGNGDVDKKLTVCADKVSAGAKEKIEKAGGSVSVSGE